VTDSLSGKNENQRWNLAGIPARERERSTGGNLSGKSMYWTKQRWI
jgi:hypothetical protein